MKSELPVGIFSGRTVTPGACISITIMVMPWCLGASGFVRTVARPKSARCAPLVQTFWPLIRQPPATFSGPGGLPPSVPPEPSPFTLVALVLMPAASDPAPGSLNSWHQITSWLRAGRTQRSTWSARACWIRVKMIQLVMP